MPLYMQFALVLMIVYAGGMTVLGALTATTDVAQAAALLSIAGLVWAFALVVIPSRLGGKYVG